MANDDRLSHLTESSNDLSWVTAAESFDDSMLDTSWSSHCKQRMYNQSSKGTYAEHYAPCGTIFSSSPTKSQYCHSCGCRKVLQEINHNDDIWLTAPWSDQEQKNQLPKVVRFSTNETSGVWQPRTARVHETMRSCLKRKVENEALSRSKQYSKSQDKNTHVKQLEAIAMSTGVPGGSLEKYACQRCHLKFDHIGALRIHIHDQHSGLSRMFKPVYGCGKCGANFFRNKVLREHLLCHHHTLATPTKNKN